MFTASEGLGGVGLRRKASKEDRCYGLFAPDRSESGLSLGGEDIGEVKQGVVTRKIFYDTQPGGPVERVIECCAPFDRCDREEEYRAAWDDIASRFGAVS